MKKPVWIIAGAVALLLIGLATTWLLYPSKKSQFAKVDKARTEMMDQLMSSNPEPEKFEEVGQKFRDEMEKLSEEERDQYMKESRQDMENPLVQMLEKNMNEFFTKPKEDQIAELDRMLDMMEQFERGGPPPFGSPQGGPPPNFGMIMMMAIATGGPLGSGGGPGSGRQSFGNDEGKNSQLQSNQQMINRVSPQMRAQAEEMQRMMGERMRLRGQ